MGKLFEGFNILWIDFDNILEKSKKGKLLNWGNPSREDTNQGNMVSISTFPILMSQDLIEIDTTWFYLYLDLFRSSHKQNKRFMVWVTVTFIKAGEKWVETLQ